MLGHLITFLHEKCKFFHHQRLFTRGYRITTTPMQSQCTKLVEQGGIERKNLQKHYTKQWATYLDGRSRSKTGSFSFQVTNITHTEKNNVIWRFLSVAVMTGALRTKGNFPL